MAMQGTAAGGTSPSITKQPLVIADREQRQAAESADAPAGLPEHMDRDLQPLRHAQVQHEVVQPAADRQAADHQTDDLLPAYQSQPDEELQPLRQRLQQRDLELPASKRQQQLKQRATPAKARKLLSTPSPARQQRLFPQQSAGPRSIADLHRFAFDASKQLRTPTGAALIDVWAALERRRRRNVAKSCTSDCMFAAVSSLHPIIKKCFALQRRRRPSESSAGTCPAAPHSAAYLIRHAASAVDAHPPPACQQAPQQPGPDPSQGCQAVRSVMSDRSLRKAEGGIASLATHTISSCGYCASTFS
jgi:hypothetical protein